MNIILLFGFAVYKMSETSSIDSFPPSRENDIEEEEITYIDVEREVSEEERHPKSKIGMKSETLLQAVRYY